MTDRPAARRPRPLRHALALLALLAALAPPVLAAQAPFRVAVIRYQHETCTFCPGGDTRIEDWTRFRGPLTGDEVLDADSYVRGFVARAREYGDVEPVGSRRPTRCSAGRPAPGARGTRTSTS